MHLRGSRGGWLFEMTQQFVHDGMAARPDVARHSVHVKVIRTGAQRDVLSAE